MSRSYKKSPYCGDKKGKDQDKFYKDLIAESEEIVEKHEKELKNERRNQNDGK